MGKTAVLKDSDPEGVNGDPVHQSEDGEPACGDVVEVGVLP